LKKLLRSGWCLIGFAIVIGAVTLEAQTTCTTAPPGVQSLFIEHTIQSSDIESTYNTDLSATTLASLASGELEIREQLLYNPQSNSLTSTIFLVPPGSTIPTPASVDITSMTLASYTISIDRVYSSCNPYPNLMFAGTITSSAGGAAAPNGIYNVKLSGTPAAVSLGYHTGNPPQFNNIVTLFAGLVVSYSQVAYGTLAFPASPVGGQPTITSVVNGASVLPGVSPNSWVTIFGSDLASTTGNWSSSIVNGALPTSLDGVQVTIGGSPAYISYISPGQINAIAPQTSSGPVTVIVTNSAGTSAAFTVPSSEYGPAFFVWPGNQAVATHLDNTFAAKAGTFPGVTTVPAKPGETIVLWGTGFGPSTPAAPVGSVVPATPTYNLSTLPTVTLNGSPVTVTGAALAPGAVGLYQVDIQVPSSIANGDFPVQATIGGMTSPPGIILSVSAP
jgi:uncharacterized protein (TIGR03437 family)